ncbi:contact-dependent growth inhibition system immunity protein [Streptomyces cellostaticus]|uniref:contact-dependent growth inhibition system immunity protein n=1 Tax=Streptomyces cellostaticus TaxID=67285 RepID=UPI002026C5C4|nr:contact-dependent growth inhibition system immunity protein [Streptomyces cellostaticus]
MTHRYPEGFLERDERFPALHELLDSYAFSGNSFTDTTDEPGVALKAYVRQAMRTPGALDAVIAEIDDLLRVGLFDDAIADDVDLLPHVEPPAGRTVEQCLATIRSHLQRVKTSGVYEQARLPQTDWEWRKRFPELSSLLGGYFHQDYPRFYDSHREALDDYLDRNPGEYLAAAAQELGDFLSCVPSDEDLDRATEILGLMVYPPDGVSLRQWLTDIEGLITHRLRRGAT